MRIHRELRDEEEYSVALDKSFVLWRAGLCPSLSWRSLAIPAAEAVVPRCPSARGLFEARVLQLGLSDTEHLDNISYSATPAMAGVQ